MIEITQLCTACNGAGTRQVADEFGVLYTQDPCEYCLGDGQQMIYNLDGTLLDDISDKLDDVKDKLDDIWEKLNE